jgi:hypothetical protein
MTSPPLAWQFGTLSLGESRSRNSSHLKLHSPNQLQQMRQYVPNLALIRCRPSSISLAWLNSCSGPLGLWRQTPNPTYTTTTPASRDPEIDIHFVSPASCLPLHIHAYFER